MELMQYPHYQVQKFSVGCKNSVGWVVTPGESKHAVKVLACKRRNCPDCGWYWAWKWRRMLEDKKLSDERMSLPAISRAITLTTAYDPGYQKVWLALKLFWKFLRLDYPNIQYWGVTEYNQKHTQPHFHFILADDTYIPQKQLVAIWLKAQIKAGFEKTAFNVRIEKIRSNIQAYFTKYLTKLTGGKDEIPRPEKWQGRYVRYSRKFFAFPVPVILSALNLNKAIEANLGLERSYFLIGPKLNLDWAAMRDFARQAVSRETNWQDWVNRDWDIVKDRARGEFYYDPIDSSKQLVLL